ncbi:MAG: energy transducer TonB, partial [Spongiibacteraceae bacterium]
MKANKFIKAVVLAAGGAIAMASTPAMAQDDAKSLDELLKLVKKGGASEARENKKREARFASARSQQAQLLEESKQTLKNEEDRSAQLEATFEEQETVITEKSRQLKERLG